MSRKLQVDESTDKFTEPKFLIRKILHQISSLKFVTQMKSLI